METMLGVRFLASEYSTGPVHVGPIYSLGIDEHGALLRHRARRRWDRGSSRAGPLPSSP
jgi:hypothetical protein